MKWHFPGSDLCTTDFRFTKGAHLNQGIIKFQHRWVGSLITWSFCYLEEQGFADVKSPRGALKKAFEMNILENGHDWMDLLQDRNLTAHTWDEQKATDMEQLIHHKYFPLLKELYNSFKQKSDEK